jgi:PERQ amino acid-rich with GYF domain-containing protein
VIKKNVNISKSKRSKLHDLLAGEELVKSNDKDAVIINSADDTSFPPLAPSVIQSDAHLSSHSTPNSEEDLFWEPCEHAKQDKYVLNYRLNFVSFSSFFLLKKWTFLPSLYTLQANL